MALAETEAVESMPSDEPVTGQAEDTVTITMPKSTAEGLSQMVSQLADLLQQAMGKVEEDISGQKAMLARQGEATPAGIGYDELAEEMNQATNARRGFAQK